VSCSSAFRVLVVSLDCIFGFVLSAPCCTWNIAFKLSWKEEIRSSQRGITSKRQSNYPFLTSVLLSLLVWLRGKTFFNPSATLTNDMFSSTQQLQLSSKTEKRPSIRQLFTQLSRNTCISWSLNVALVVTTIVLLLVASLDAVQAAFCVHFVGSCITCAVLVWTKDSRNAFRMSLGFSLGHFVVLLFIIWDCEPLTYVFKLAIISGLLFVTLVMRISGARFAYALEQKPKSRVRFTIVELLIGASLVLVASFHLAYPEHEALSFAEMALWCCFLVDALWHFGIWKKTSKRVFRTVKGKMTAKRNTILKMIEGVKRRQNITSTVGVLFTEIVACATMIFVNPALDLLLQGKSNECKKRNLVGSHRISAFGFPIFLALHMTYWVLIYSHVMRKRRDQKIGVFVNASQQAVVLPHHGPNSGLAETNKASEREMKCHSSSSPFVLPHYE
jgi:hypothetical protein